MPQLAAAVCLPLPACRWDTASLSASLASSPSSGASSCASATGVTCEMLVQQHECMQAAAPLPRKDRAAAAAARERQPEEHLAGARSDARGLLQQMQLAVVAADADGTDAAADKPAADAAEQRWHAALGAASSTSAQRKHSRLHAGTHKCTHHRGGLLSVRDSAALSTTLLCVCVLTTAQVATPTA